MQYLVFVLFLVLCVGSLFRPLWALVLALLMYPMEQSLQGSVPMFIAYPPLANLCTALVVGVAAMQSLARQNRAFTGYFTAVWWLVMALHAWMLVTLLWTPANPQAWEITRDGLPYFALFLLAAPILIDELSDLESFAKLILIFGTLTAVTIITNPEFNFQYGRLGLAITGKVRTSPLAMGELGGTLVIAAALYRGDRFQAFMNLVRIAAFIIGAVLALYSGSRGQILFAGFVAILFFPMCRPQKSIFTFFGTVVLVLMFVAALILVAGQVLEGDMIKRWSADQLTRGTTARELNFTELLMAFAKTPHSWLFGLGFNAFTAVTNASNEPYSHNIILDALCELGVGAFAVMCIIMWLTFRAGVRLFNLVRNDPIPRAMVTLLLAFCVYQFMLSNKQGMLWTSGPLFLHYLMVVRLDARERALAAPQEEEPMGVVEFEPA